MPFFPSISRRPFRLLAVAATAVAATALTVSTAAATPAPTGSAVAAPATDAALAKPHQGGGAEPRQAGSLAATIALEPGCSASLVRFPTSLDSDPAMMLTNGHCWEGGLLAPDQVLVNLPSTRTGELLDAAGRTVEKVRADRLLYATMTGTDAALYRLTKTLGHLKTSTGLDALTISASHPVDGRPISVPSGYWRIVYSCTLNGFVNTLQEAVWTWHDSIRYLNPNDTGCQIIGGTSGSPIVDETTGEVVGVNNTFNESGEACTLNNPCEVGSDGSLTYHQGQDYGQQTYWFTTCLTPGNQLDLGKAGCLLPKPLPVIP